jgi:hypothetical protein
MSEFAIPERGRPSGKRKVPVEHVGSDRKAFAPVPGSTPRHALANSGLAHDFSSVPIHVEPSPAQYSQWPAVAAALASEGSPLDAPTRNVMEPRFGLGLRDVRVHADGRAASAAHALNARAFTVGNHVVFAPGGYQPGEPGSRSLLMHELAHVVQQSSPASAGAGAVGSPQEVPPELERSAQDAAGGRVATLPRLGRPLIQRVGIFEAIARFFGGGTFPPQELVAYLELLRRTQQIEGHYDSDNKAREVVRRSRAGEPQFSGLTEPIRVLLVKEMLDGYVSGADENAILDLLTEAPPQEAQRMIASVGQPTLRQRFSGVNLKRLVALIETTEIEAIGSTTWTARRVRAILQHEGRDAILDELAANGWGVWSFTTAFDTWQYPDGHTKEEEVQGLRGNTDRDAKLIRISEHLDDESAATTLIHESFHFLATPEMNPHPAATHEQFLQEEVDARVSAEEYRIKRGLPPTKPGYRKPDGTVDVAFIHTEVFASPHYNPTTRHRVGQRRWVGDHRVPGMPPGSAGGQP